METVGVGRRKNSRALVIGLGLLAVCLLGLSGYLYVQYRGAVARHIKSDDERIAAITRRVGKAVLLPDEKPSIATVKDTSKLAEAQLAARARDGDEILVYSKARRVVLYRPSEGKIVDMFRVETLPVTPPDSGAAGAEADNAVPPPSITPR